MGRRLHSLTSKKRPAPLVFCAFHDDMVNPFFIEGPAVISFSGGRTSAFMLYKIIEAHGGALPDDVYAVFADTGKERPETLEFVRECERQWSVPVHWVERPGQFGALIEDRKPLPNSVFRFCTGDLKIKPIRKFIRSKGHKSCSMVIGIRADEPARVAKNRGKVEENFEYEVPLAEAGITEDDVMAFWAEQPFDLQLRQDEGNCDLCFLKGKRKLIRLMIERPDLAKWWIEQEDKKDDAFIRGSSYRQMLAIANNLRQQTHLDFDVDVRHVSRIGKPPRQRPDLENQLCLLFPDDDSKPCLCGD